MTTDETQTWALVRTLGPNAVGAEMFLAFAPSAAFLLVFHLA